MINLNIINQESREEALLSALGWVNIHCKTLPDLIIVVDFNVPSGQKRLHVFDTKNGMFLLPFTLHTSHGSGSCSTQLGKDMACYFSNTPGSHMSSLGAMLVDEEYTGKHGRSIRLIGLEKGINNEVHNRAIVIHGAEYMTEEFIIKNDRAGLSEGCFAINPAEMDSLIRLVKRNRVLLYAHFTNEGGVSADRKI